MGILLGFLPFIAAAVLNPLLGPAIGLTVAAVLAAIQILRNRRAGLETGILDVGSLLLFAGLAAVFALTGGAVSTFAIRLTIDAGLLVIVLASMAARRPFTLPYARRVVPEHLWHDPRFLKINQIITGAWAIAFLLTALADAAVVFVPGFPAWLGLAIMAAALAAAIVFSRRFPAWLQARRARARAAAGDPAA
jgi:hypothetical protein